jgi:hypothetical protein
VTGPGREFKSDAERSCPVPDDDASEWSSPWRAVAYDEARAVLEPQQGTASDIDDKALRTVRLVVVLVGLLVSTIRITDVSVALPLLVPGLGFLLGSVVAGTFTYSESDPYQGPGPAYLDQLVDAGTGDADWEREHLGTLGDWIAENADEIAFNGLLFVLTQVFLLLGVTLLALALLA